MLPSSDCSVACVKGTGGLSIYWMAVGAPTEGSSRNCKKKRENKTPVLQSKVGKLGVIILHKVILKKRRVAYQCHRHNRDGQGSLSLTKTDKTGKEKAGIGLGERDTLAKMTSSGERL